MAIEVVMPKLGWTMEEGTLVEWIKQDGDEVNPGDIMFIVESDKALNEIESFETGIFRIPDETVLGKLLPVGTLLAYITASPDEPLPTGQPAHESEAEVASDLPSEDKDHTSTVSPTPTVSHNKDALPTISPRARRVALELGVEWQNLTGSGRTGRIVERDVRAAVAGQSDVHISPVAKRVAKELGVDVAALAEQMPGQKIMREHVEQAAQQISPRLPIQAAPDDQRVPLSGVRQRIAERMATSAHTTAPVTLTTEVDATELVKLRNELKATGEVDARPVPAYNDLLAKLVSEALREHPQLNARIEGDTMITSHAVHMGFAVDTPRGLFVPVIRDVQNKSIRTIAAEALSLVEQTRNGTIRGEDMRDGTFTITNLGMYEIDAFTPIINLPQCAILGVGRIVPKQIVIDEEAERVAIRKMMFLSLTFDHRLVDGAPAARFLRRVKQLIEHPYLWLVN